MMENDRQILDYAETLGEPIQRFADVLENEFKGITYFIGTSYRGNGYAAEALQCLIDYLFARYSLKNLLPQPGLKTKGKFSSNR